MKISIIIPTLNEAGQIAANIHALRKVATLKSGRVIPHEIIVVDGGSSDETVSIARQFADIIITSPKGRARQMNAAAQQSTGDILIFLHADTIFPPGALTRLWRMMHDTSVIGGGFSKDWQWSFKIRLSGFLQLASKFWEGVGNWLVVLFQKFPGDNAIFVRKSIFFQLHGFRLYWICEDLDFSFRMAEYCKHHREQKTIKCLDFPVFTSTRRFEEYGFTRIWIWWILIYFLWRWGWSQVRLQKFTEYYLQFTKSWFRKIGQDLLF